MDKLAEFLGYTKAVYYTGQMSYFVRVGDRLEFVGTVKGFNPKVKNDQFIQVMDKIINMGGIVTVQKINNRTSKYYNHQVTIEMSNRIITKTGLSYKQATVECLTEYLKK